MKKKWLECTRCSDHVHVLYNLYSSGGEWLCASCIVEEIRNTDLLNIKSKGVKE